MPSAASRAASGLGAWVAWVRKGLSHRLGAGVAAGLVLVVGFAGVAVAANAPQVHSRQARVAVGARAQRAVSRRTVLRVSGDALRWTPVAGASRYLLDTAVGRSAASYERVRGTRFTPALRPGATVRYRVRADLGGAPWTRFVSIRYERPTMAALAAANVAPTLTVANGKISWAAQAGVNDFSGAVSTAPRGAAGRTTTYQDLGNVTSWTPAPQPGQTLYFGVASNGPAGQVWSDEVSISWSANNSAPVLTVANGKISWPAQPAATDFKAAVSTAATGGTSTYQDLGNVSSWSPAAQPGQTVYYGVASEGPAGEQWSARVSISWPANTPPPSNSAPVLTVANGKISWAAQASVSDYSGAISTAPNGAAGRTTTYQDLGNATSWTPAPAPGQTLYYGVASNGPAGQQWASEVSITWPSSGGQSGGSGSGYQVNQNVIQYNGKNFWPHGVDRDTTEWSCSGQTADGSGYGVPAGDFTTMKNKWGANIVRIALNEDFWDPDGNEYCSSYKSNIEAAVASARAAGLVVVLDLHWSDAGGTARAAQQCMADAHSDEMWKDLATIYKGDSGVWFELYNEPENISWSVWQNGGSACGFNVVGMQQLVNDIRAQGATNIVVACGIGYCSHDDGMPKLAGANIAYAIHPYSNNCGNTSCENQWSSSDWMNRFGYLTQTGPVPSGDKMNDVPVIATEFGDFTCGGTSYDNGILQFFQQNGIGYTAWAWYTGGCAYPALISDAAGDCQQGMGCTIQQNLLGFANGSLQMTIPGGGPSQSATSAVSSAAGSKLTNSAGTLGTGQPAAGAAAGSRGSSSASSAHL